MENAKETDKLRDHMSAKGRNPADAVTFADLIALNEETELAPERAKEAQDKAAAAGKLTPEV